MRVWPGQPRPLGPTWDGEGVNFVLFSDHASRVELCLFAAPGAPREADRVVLPHRGGGLFHAYLPDVRPGQAYGYRVHGPYEPRAGLRFNPNKLLVDPYARAIAGAPRWSDALFGYTVGHADADLSFDERDSAPDAPRSLVVESGFSWGHDRPPRTPWHRTVIYECHVKGMTMRHPGVPEELRGTYLGLATDAVIDHLVELGVTAVELLPVHHSITPRRFAEQGLTNYWGYDTLGFFAPDERFATVPDGRQVHEFKSMVKSLHRAGLEVILDVVYNHTCEGDELGPTLSLRGIDGVSYYRLREDARRHHVDTTGCGNALDLRHPRALQLVMDSLRYWVTEMHVDGFRFDLATTLGRTTHGFDPRAPFFGVIEQDPMLSRVKLIAEPWDLGLGGYQAGAFPVGWAEWNDKYRDAVRRFWRGDDGMVPELARRISGSSDLFEHSGRTTHASIDYVTCHDGFTLHDAVSYERKHNGANAEANRDGSDANWSCHWGVEGETDVEAIVELRERIKRNMLATLVLSQGVPMLCAGDELGRTQRGNNNAWCQDDETSWLDWELGPRRRELLDFTRRVLRLFRRHSALRRREFFRGAPEGGRGRHDVRWLRRDGVDMTEDDWHDPAKRTFGLLIDGRCADDVDERGRPIVGDTLLLLLNAAARSRAFTLPELDRPGTWRVALNTATPTGAREQTPRGRTRLVPHSLVLLRRKEA